MDNSFYNPSEQPTSEEKEIMWKSISQQLDSQKTPTILNLHWRSFWVGNAAAILVGFALIGIYSTSNFFLDTTQQKDSEQQVYETLKTATNQLRELPPLLINEASENHKHSLESTMHAIEEIDILIDELKEDILLKGETPVKRNTLKRLYATKLEFYTDLLLNQEFES